MDRFGMHEMARTVLRSRLCRLNGHESIEMLQVRVWSFGYESMWWMIDRSMNRMAMYSIL